MAIQLTAADARQSLNDHLAARGREIHEKFGPNIGWRELRQILEDRACVRYPCEVVFDAGPLEPGEFAHPVAKGRTSGGWLYDVRPSVFPDAIGVRARLGSLSTGRWSITANSPRRMTPKRLAPPPWGFPGTSITRPFAKWPAELCGQARWPLDQEKCSAAFFNDVNHV